ncbi:MAG TPA: hypothetical protein VGC46_08965 [Allosphingosinicella sp.]
MADLTIDDFLPWVDHACEATAPDGQVTMTLVDAQPLPHAQRDGGGFRLEFKGPAEPVLGQSIMMVTGPAGTHEIFLVPIAQDSSATRYEAIFY